MSLSPLLPDSGAEADLRAIRGDKAVLAQALDAQAALLPYALAFFGISLPIFVWAASFAANGIWALASLAIFAINWGAYYGLVTATRREPRLVDDLSRRTRLNILAGLLWAVAIAQISIFALGAGPAREPLLMLAAGGAVVCFFFTAPSLSSLLVVGPAAAAGPLIGLNLFDDTRQAGGLALGAVALAAALCLVLNRILARQFALTSERERLIEGRAESLAQAERLAKSKSDLLATLSHEVRDGLTGVAHVLAAAAGAGGRAAPSREQLNAALDASRELLGVLNATLDAEQAQAGELSVKAGPFDPASLARDVVMLSRPAAAARNLEISVHVESEVADDPGAAMADRERVRQILGVLIGNAVKYTLRGRVEVRVRKLAADRIRFEVADTGPGLSPDELERAYVPFTRIERTSAGSSGAGLGLSLARQLTALMGGDLSADSAVGVGSCFWLDLPYDAAARREGELAAAGPPTSLSPRALRVLIAEGDALNAAMLRACLEQLGHQVVLAQKASRAVEILRACDIDLVIAGACEADMAADTVRVVRQAHAAPIVAVITGDPEEAAECSAAGADQVLRRPVTVPGLARVLTALWEIEKAKALAAA